MTVECVNKHYVNFLNIFFRFTVHAVDYLVTHTNTGIYIYMYVHMLVCVTK